MSRSIPSARRGWPLAAFGILWVTGPATPEDSAPTVDPRAVALLRAADSAIRATGSLSTGFTMQDRDKNEVVGEQAGRLLLMRPGFVNTSVQRTFWGSPGGSEIRITTRLVETKAVIKRIV